jgi:hypothetical protein
MPASSPVTFPVHAPLETASTYLDLMKRCLLNWLYADAEDALVRAQGKLPEARLLGRDWPAMAHTMIGLARLENIQFCVEIIIKENIPGDFLEAGVWRGGACIFLRAILQAYQIKDRTVWAADSFAGLPPPNPALYPHDAGLNLHQFPQLAVSLDKVKFYFSRYGLLDDQVRFLPGWFRDTLPRAPITRLALLRIDADLYESTMDVLKHLYFKVVPGGFVIIDDYQDIAACRHAVEDYRKEHGITETIMPIDWTGVYWRRQS